MLIQEKYFCFKKQTCKKKKKRRKKATKPRLPKLQNWTSHFWWGRSKMSLPATHAPHPSFSSVCSGFSTRHVCDQYLPGARLRASCWAWGEECSLSPALPCLVGGGQRDVHLHWERCMLCRQPGVEAGAAMRVSADLVCVSVPYTHTHTCIHMNALTHMYLLYSCMQIHTRTHTSTPIHTHAHTNSHLHQLMLTPTPTYVHTHIYTHAHTGAHLHSCSHTHLHPHMHTWICTSAHVHVHTPLPTPTYTHLHTPLPTIQSYTHPHTCTYPATHIPQLCKQKHARASPLPGYPQ